MLIKIDNREHELIRCIRMFIDTLPIFSQIQIEVCALPLGDIILSLNGEDKWIIERKSINDLASSIKDGRYEEQSYRLNGIDHPNHNIVYLIEGDVNRPVNNRFKDRIDKFTLYSAIFSLSYFKGFSVLRTFSVEESALFICNCANKMRKDVDRKPYFPLFPPLGKVEPNQINVLDKQEPNQTNVLEKQEPNQTNVLEKQEPTQVDPEGGIFVNSLNKVEQGYVNVVKKVKKENVTAGNIDEIFLCQIPGISSVGALAVIKQFGSIASLIEKGKQDPQSLFNITYVTEKGQTRKLSKPCVQNILDYLVNK